MNELIDAIGVDKCFTLNIIEKQYGKDYYDKIKKVWDEYPNEQYYIKMSVDYFYKGRQTATNCKIQLNRILVDHHIIEED